MMSNVCEKCAKVGSFLFLAFGVLFLLRDFAMWNFWNISWYTALFLIIGVMGFAAATCPMCKAMRKKK